MTRNELKKELDKYGYMYAQGSDTSESPYLDGSCLFVYNSQDDINTFDVIEDIFISEEMTNCFCVEGRLVPEPVLLACYRYASTPLEKKAMIKRFGFLIKLESSFFYLQNSI